MTFEELLTQVTELLQRQGRVSYGALRRRFALDDAYLQDLKDELIDAQQVALDEGGTILVWRGRTAKEETRKGTPEQPPLQTLASVHPEAERRQLTVMFCDLVGSTSLAEKLDPEELREVILAYQETGAQVTRRFEGYLARYIGDGLLIYFGYPQAHEDDASRAVRAGLGIVTALPDLNRHLQQTFKVLQDFPLQVRLGIHTGLVVAGEMGGGGYCDPLAIVGETPNIAARLQGMAEPDTVVMSEATHRLVHGLFTYRDLGPQELKGVSTPITVYHVVGESTVQSRFEVAVRSGLTPLVGREQELELLLQHWEKVKGREGQVILLSGEAGIGKSRLVQELKERVAKEGAPRIEFRCSPYYRNTAFYPVIEHLQRLLQFRQEDSPPEKLMKLEQMLRGYSLALQEAVPLFAALLSLPHPAEYPPISLTPQKQKQKTQEALGAWLLEEAERKTVLAVWEDLQWADPSTLELHGLFMDRTATAPLLTLLTFRPEFASPWGTRAYLTSIMLSRLGRIQAEEMVSGVIRGKLLPTEILQQIVSKTDGVPLFIEELTKMVLESGLVRQLNNHYELTGPLPPLAIPATLQDSLMARLDRLATVKEVAQIGATMGREFSYELLRAVSPLEETSLQQALEKLVEAEVLYQGGVPSERRYFFKHALVQDVAYQSLLKSARQQYHQRIAQVLAEHFPETADTQPELLARDVLTMHEQTEALVALATAQGFPFYVVLGTGGRGWALAMQGQGEEGITQIRQGIAAFRATGAASGVPFLYTMLADAAAHLGHPEDGLQALAEAHTLVEQHEERVYEAEIYRLRGVLLLQQTGTPQEEAEIWLQRALDVARRQEAKSLELRAAMSLSRLWQQQGKKVEAYNLLAPVYNWFTEGFDTKDLQEAKALLEKLS